MSTITTRSGKGSALTHAEVDANFTNLNTDKAQIKRTTFDSSPAATQVSISTSSDSNVYKYVFVIADLAYSSGPNNIVAEIGRIGTYASFTGGTANTTGTDGSLSSTDLFTGLGNYQSPLDGFILELHKTTDRWVVSLQASLGSSGYYFVNGYSTNIARDYISNFRLGTGSSYNFTICQGHLLEYS